MIKTLAVPAAVRAQFDRRFVPSRGQANPEDQTNPVWAWLVETGTRPYAVRKATGQHDGVFPGWTFERFGQTETRLPDGSSVWIGGEHEDFYAPDFYIYNDVVLRRPDGTIRIFGYPEEVFPPTDFHSATLIGESIYVLGGLRYVENRERQGTHVYRLDLADFSIRRVVTRGEGPAWLFDHEASLDASGSAIACSGGTVTHAGTGWMVENLTDWTFDTVTGRWIEGATRPVIRWLLMREDDGANQLWKVRSAVKDSMAALTDAVEDMRREFAAAGVTLDPEPCDARAAPSGAHRDLGRDPEDEPFDAYRIGVDGVTVRYVVDSWRVTVTVEGSLSDAFVDRLKRHGVEMFSRLDGVAWTCVPL